MSAYGKIAAPKGVSDAPLAPRIYRLPDASRNLAVVPLRKPAAPEALVAYLHGVFNAIVEEGRTYPQEDKLTLQEFTDYFLGYDLFVGLLVPNALVEGDGESKELSFDFFPNILSRPGGPAWGEIVAGCYYIKPNYPGRSSHCCNAGFIVDPRHRGLKLGRTLGKSYLHYGPRLGYKYSVFNLVYVNNIASAKIWDSLGFSRVGLVPKAGRLRTADGRSEEYVDAYVYWRDFETPIPTSS